MSDNKFKFDKFIDDICKREKREKIERIDEDADQEKAVHPQKTYNRLYREKWQNSTRFTRRVK